MHSVRTDSSQMDDPDVERLVEVAESFMDHVQQGHRGAVETLDVGREEYQSQRDPDEAVYDAEQLPSLRQRRHVPVT